MFFDIEKIFAGKQHWKNMMLELRVYRGNLLQENFLSENGSVGPVKQLIKLTWINYAFLLLHIQLN